MKTIKLSPAEQEFYWHVKRAIFANPFSDERLAVDRFLTGSTRPPDNIRLIGRLLQVVEERLNRTFAGSPWSIIPFRDGERDLIRFAILFHIYHQYCQAFDGHIREQIGHEAGPCPVPFARQALDHIAGCGIPRREALRYFALFFQMRRAFFFIDRIIGTSPCMKELRRNLWNNIFTHDIGLYDAHLEGRMEDFSTLLLGATGTGKGLCAAAIGRSGFISFDEKKNTFRESFTRAFVSLNLSQFPEQLLESELFGHKKGSFTGAVESHEGVFSRCSPAGAIFLDEIGEVAVPVQIKLLQVLQDRIYFPVGSHRSKRFGGRVIAATNRRLTELRLSGRFRDDFYYRLCSDVIEVPPLARRIRENPGELDDLLVHTLGRIVGNPSAELVAGTGELLHRFVPADYPWPGNVRELEQCVRRILLKKHYEGDLVLTALRQEDPLQSLAESGLTASQLVSRYCTILYERHGTYEAVARLTELDRRTVKKHIDSAEKAGKERP